MSGTVTRHMKSPLINIRSEDQTPVFLAFQLIFDQFIQFATYALSRVDPVDQEIARRRLRFV